MFIVVFLIVIFVLLLTAALVSLWETNSDSLENQAAIASVAAKFCTHEKRITTMADQLTQLTTDVATLTQTVSDVQSAVATEIGNLQNQLVALQNHPAAADLSGPISGIETAISNLKALVPAPAAVPAPDASNN